MSDLEREVSALMSSAAGRLTALQLMAERCATAASALGRDLTEHTWFEDETTSYEDQLHYIEIDGFMTAFELVWAEIEILGRSLVDHTRALGLLLGDGAGALAPITVSRAAFEAGVRIASLLDSKLESEQRLQRAANQRLARLWSSQQLQKHRTEPETAEAATIRHSLEELVVLADEEGWTLHGKFPPYYGSPLSLAQLAASLVDHNGYRDLAPYMWRLSSSISHSQLMPSSMAWLGEQGWDNPDPGWLAVHTFGAPLGLAAAAFELTNYSNGPGRAADAASELLGVWSRLIKRGA